MNADEIAKEQMKSYINRAISSLEYALNVVEADDAFNDGQSKVLNEIYDKVAKVIDELK